jgi:hypothetical protein
VTAQVRIADVSRRGREWADRQDPGSLSGTAIGAWRRYRAVEGPLQSAPLSLYVLVAVLPALLVMEEYLDPHPAALGISWFTTTDCRAKRRACCAACSSRVGRTSSARRCWESPA